MNKCAKISIGDKFIGNGERTFIIAEAGSNHNRSLEQAKNLIIVAAQAGADAVKFQTFSAEKIVAQNDGVNAEKSVHDIIKSIELPRDWHYTLAKFAQENGIIFLSTPFDEAAVDLLDDLGIPVFKIASGDITNLPLLRYTAKKMKPMIISTGASTLGETEEAINAIRQVGNEQIILMHCVASYPTRIEDANLAVINTISNTFNLPTGYSDHTLGILTPVISVAMGAVLIEKHFTLNKSMAGPDHFYAIEPAELKTMVENIRIVETLKGYGTKRVITAELECQKLGRRSIYANADIPAGSTLTKEVLSILRPAVGIDPKFLDIVIGRKTTSKINRYESITWDKI